MATHLDDNSSAAKGASVCDEIAAALEGDDDTLHLAGVWNGLVARGDGLAARVLAAERALGRARARLDVIDARWDGTDSAFGRATLDASKGNRKEPPYSTFYGKNPPSTVNDFGVAREVQFGRTVISVLDADPSSPLTTEWKPRWEADTDALSAAVKVRDDSIRAEAALDVEVALFIADVNTEVDRLEGDLLKIFPRQPKRVASFLEPLRRAKGGKRRRKKDDGDGEA